MKKLLFFALLITSSFSYSQTQIGNDIDGSSTGEEFGTSVSLNSDGSIVAIGAINNDDISINSGQVQVYENIGGVWTQIGEDLNGENNNDIFGYSVSLSSDGSVLAVGALGNSNNSGKGYVSLFRNVNGNWIKIGNDLEGQFSTDRFGWSVSLSSDGSIIAIGVVWSDSNGNNSGQVQVFENVGDIWTQLGGNINGSNLGDQFGFSVSLSSDGSTVAVGADRNDEVAQDSGQVQVYENIGGIWTQIGDNLNGEGNTTTGTERFGFNVSLNSDGSILAVGAPGNDGNGFFSGNVRIYKNIGGVWTQIGEDINGESQTDQSGWSLSLSSDGSVIAIGAILNENGPDFFDRGHVRVYRNVNNNWVQIGIDIDGEGNGDEFGWSVSLSSQGNILAIGGRDNTNINGSNAGHVRVYDLSSVLSTERNDISQFNLYPNPTKDQFTIQLKEGIEIQKISIFNQLGQFISSTTSKSMDVKNLSQGMYFLEITTDKGRSIKKLIID